LRSGDEIEADLIVTATGLQLQFLGGATLEVDGEPPQLSETMAYKGMMLSGVPNLMFAVGYTNASWTLKVDIVCAYACRLLNHLETHGFDYCVPRRDPEVKTEPLIDFTSGYIQRSLHLFPQGGAQTPWKLHQNYALDSLALRFSRLEDGTMDFVRRQP
jgi:cation diffusion facilitator CzcD-associated flavoprotein CzcO